MQAIPKTGKKGAANLLASCVVVPRSKPAAGIKLASRLASDQNLRRRHPLLFMRWLLAAMDTEKEWEQLGKLAFRRREKLGDVFKELSRLMKERPEHPDSKSLG